jgi:hypothetical protein
MAATGYCINVSGLSSVSFSISVAAGYCVNVIGLSSGFSSSVAAGCGTSDAVSDNGHDRSRCSGTIATSNSNYIHSF